MARLSWLPLAVAVAVAAACGDRRGLTSGGTAGAGAGEPGAAGVAAGAAGAAGAGAGAGGAGGAAEALVAGNVETTYPIRSRCAAISADGKRAYVSTLASPHGQVVVLKLP